MVNIRAEIDELVRQFVDDLEQLVRRAALESVKEALEGESVPASPAAAPAPRRKRGPRRGVRRSSANKEKLARALVEHVKANPGAKMEEIKAAVGSESRILRPIVNRLLEKDILRKEGEKRATRYFVGKKG